MKSLVLELQEDAYNSTSDITSLLRKAYVVAKKLKISEFENWIHKELNGYPASAKGIPEYREIQGEVKAWNPYHGWIPVLFDDARISAKISKNFIVQPVTEIELLVKSSKGTLVMSLSHQLQRQLDKTAPFETQYQLQFGVSQAKKILETVRNVVLEWALKLEEDGILGEGISFSKEEKSLANEKGYTVNHFYGDINQSQIQQNSDNSTQNMHLVNGLDIKSLTTLVNQIESNIANTGLKGSEQEAITNEIEKIKDEIMNSTPNPGVIKKSLKIMGSILEKATSSLIASGLIHEISKLGL
ncbi:hypothetical protein [Paenibacillus whitsoniae]|uniref:AbiTii domain-containing protein n=1 Tax=Paenibacillus whitsoniae TaxID=2496558 RepID=A0A3S0A3E8_9BACL|nr:hypothetical protein [Paenibacillus whitsoniae]RTE08591.1 hypothetical protein EJQ19_16540 [Paenibacillus whitsoniae]